MKYTDRITKISSLWENFTQEIEKLAKDTQGDREVFEELEDLLYSIDSSTLTSLETSVLIESIDHVFLLEEENNE
jgi:hypothetical protein